MSSHFNVSYMMACEGGAPLVKIRKQEQKTKHGGWRKNAGRKPERVKRKHKTFWVSDEEAKKIKEYLLRNRVNELKEELPV